jgi:hypothetical protein
VKWPALCSEMIVQCYNHLVSNVVEFRCQMQVISVSFVKVCTTTESFGLKCYWLYQKLMNVHCRVLNLSFFVIVCTAICTTEYFSLKCN